MTYSNIRHFSILLGLAWCLFSGVYGKSDWQFWHSQVTKGKWDKNTTANLELHMRFKDDISDFFYYHAQTSFMIRTFKSNYCGVEIRPTMEKSSENIWRYECRSGIIFTNKLNLGKFAFDSRFRFYYRSLQGRNNRGAIRARLGLSFHKSSYFSPYVNAEIFYNHNDFQEYDRNRVSAGFTGKLNKYIGWKLYYMHQDNRSSRNGPWKDIHILGFDINGSI